MKTMNWSLFVCVILMNTIHIQANNECEKSKNCESGLLERGKKLITAVAKDLIHINTQSSDLSGLFGLNILNVEQMFIKPALSQQKRLLVKKLQEGGPELSLGVSEGKLLRTLRSWGWGRTGTRNRQLGILHCNGIDILGHLSRDTRRLSIPGDNSVILGAPLYPYHLPKAEPILPGHTLIRPAVHMLKSAVKFPHRDQENGAGVYGHIDNLGIKYDGRHYRVLYSGFRRSIPKLLSRRLLQLQNYKTSHQKVKKDFRNYEKKFQENEPIYYYFTGYQDKPKHTKLKHARDFALAQTFEAKKMEFRDLLRLINSLRRDQESKENVRDQPKKYVPGTAGLDSFVLEPDPEEEVKTKSKLFWDTKGAFNHIKVNPLAPELADFLPINTNDSTRNWWFYHQADFKEFEDR